MTIGALAFMSPWLLAGLIALPIIYWLLRTVPPRPKQVIFPPTRILAEVDNVEKTPAQTPWWLMLIRLLAAALVIFALADPVLNPNRGAVIEGKGPLVILVDNTWAAADQWRKRQVMMERLIGQAQSASRLVVVAPTARAIREQAIRVQAPWDARSTASGLAPQPYGPDRAWVLKRLGTVLAGKTGVSIVWLSDGLVYEKDIQPVFRRMRQLADGSLTVVDVGAGDEPLAVAADLGKVGRLEAIITRPGGAARTGLLHAFSKSGHRLGEAKFQFTGQAQKTRTFFELPLELRNQVSRIVIAGVRSAGSVHLLDGRANLQRIALIGGVAEEQEQPLLGALYYLTRAIKPYSSLLQPEKKTVAENLDAAIAQNATVIILVDHGKITGGLAERVNAWVEKGGMLVRFAGPRLEEGGDNLLPVPLRLGGRALGGALSWSTPQPLAKLPDDGPFVGLAAPQDVLINRQLLADPGRIGQDVKVWARLKDGTPLVTAGARGSGQLVLFHVTANTDWSNLPLSGLFVEMMRRIATLGRVGGQDGFVLTGGQIAGAGRPARKGYLPPILILDGFGKLRPPRATTRAIPVKDFAKTEPGLEHPPGYYGPKNKLRALNIAGVKTVLKPLSQLPAGAKSRTYEGDKTVPLRPWLLMAAMALLFLDTLAVLLLRVGGGFSRLFQARPRMQSQTRVGSWLALVVGGMALLAAAGGPNSAAAQSAAPKAKGPAGKTTATSRIDIPKSIIATSKVTFGYVITGNSQVDSTSRAGLAGLSKILSLRTAIEPGKPMAVDVVRDEIAFFPVLYWPVLANVTRLDDKTIAKIDAYMRRGGMIIFDTRDFGLGGSRQFGFSTGTKTPLQRLLGNLSVPRLEPVPDGHVLTKSFYLLNVFPGRWDGGQLWVEAQGKVAGGGRRARRADGVSSILVTSNDFAAAWALDESNRPLFPTVPGGPAQREMAFRVGINIAMYALTGNYKADQVHVPALLERLGQ